MEASGLAAALRRSVWAYPLINAAHLLGVALLVGAIIPLDLRLLGAWRREPWPALYRVLTRSAMAGLMLAAAAGALLFITRATEYAAAGFFQLKMLLVVLGLANALVLGRWPQAAQEAPSWRLRLAAAISLPTWLAVLTLGRLVGYF